MQNIILLHGALGSLNDFEPLKKVLKKHDITTHAMSFSGHGDSPFENSFGIEQFAKELSTYIEKEKLEKPNVFGFSMGGYIALYLAGKHPELIDKIITLGTKFEWNEEVIEKQKKFLDFALIEKNPLLAKHLNATHGAKLGRLLENTSHMLHDIVRENLLNPDFLSTIQNKVLIGIADGDQLVTVNETIGIYKSIPKGNMYMLPKSKHPIESSNFELLGTIIADFVQNL
jgi:pimeloyl-ACP methyl ester carboxylesterase